MKIHPNDKAIKVSGTFCILILILKKKGINHEISY
jgi:hypothetical protein